MKIKKHTLFLLWATALAVTPLNYSVAADEGFSLGAPPSFTGEPHGDGKAALQTNNTGVLTSNGFYVGPKANAPKRKPVSATEMMKKRGMVSGGGGAWYHPSTQGNSEGLSLGGPADDVRHGSGKKQTTGLDPMQQALQNMRVQEGGIYVGPKRTSTQEPVSLGSGKANLQNKTASGGVTLPSSQNGGELTLGGPKDGVRHGSGKKYSSTLDPLQQALQNMRAQEGGIYVGPKEGAPDREPVSATEMMKKRGMLPSGGGAWYHPDTQGNSEGLSLGGPANGVRHGSGRAILDNQTVGGNAMPSHMNARASSSSPNMAALEPLTENFKFFLRQPRNKELANRIASNPQLIDYLVKHELSQTQVQSFSSSIDDVMKQAKIVDVTSNRGSLQAYDGTFR